MNVLEPDQGETLAVTFCFTATVATPRINPTFDFALSPTTTATSGSDFFPISQTLVIPTNFTGNFMRCIDVLIIGDNQQERTEIVAYELIPRSSIDRVVFPNGTDLLISIVDNDGKLQYGYLVYQLLSCNILCRFNCRVLASKEGGH